MTVLEFFKNQIADEAITTRKMLSQIPSDKFDWQPHPKSMNIQTLANHIAELPYWVKMSLFTNELDFSNNPYTPTRFRNSSELLKFFEEGLEEAYLSLDKATEEMLAEKWVLRDGEMVLWDTTKGDSVRTSISQLIHHRAQLGVFLRLLNVPIPGSYGPSADEMEFYNVASVNP